MTATATTTTTVTTTATATGNPANATTVGRTGHALTKVPTVPTKITVTKPMQRLQTCKEEAPTDASG